MSRDRIHPLILDAQELVRGGQMSRRDFLRLSSLLGLSAAGASVLAACGGAQPPQAPAATEAATEAAKPAATEAVATEAATEAAKRGLVRGGTLTVTCRVDEVDHPASFPLSASRIPGPRWPNSWPGTRKSFT